MHAGNEDILAAVVIVIADGNAIVEPRSRQSGLGRDIGEVALPVVLEKPVGVLIGRASCRERVFEAV
jgi:hypothetical protein